MTTRYPDTTGAPCTLSDPAPWFPDGANSGTRNVARRLCEGCQVIEACLAWALEHHEDYGIWGGRSAHDRREMQKVRRTPR